MVRSFIASLTVVVTIGVLGSPAFAQSTPADLVRGLLAQTPTTVPANFADAFLAQLPYSQVRAIAKDYVARFGDVTNVVPSGADQLVTFAKGSVLVNVHVDAANKIDGILFHDEMSPADEAALRAFFASQKIDTSAFAPSFLSLVPAAQLETGLTQLSAAVGAFVRLEARPTGYVGVYEKGELPVHISLDTNGKIALLKIDPPTPKK